MDKQTERALKLDFWTFIFEPVADKAEMKKQSLIETMMEIKKSEVNMDNLTEDKGALFYKGKPVEEMSKRELLTALVATWKVICDLRRAIDAIKNYADNEHGFYERKSI